jgi:catechol 2,3-dioxygenase-like lactoylglutathione lyase family enzyme
MSDVRSTPTPVVVRAIDHLVLNVRDVEVTVAWYERVLGMIRRDFHPGEGKLPRTSLVFGDQKINVRPVSFDKESWFTADNASAGSDDLCFLTDVAPDTVFAHLQACGVAVELGPVEKEGARGRLKSVYCRDPDGNLIEISSYS